MVEYGSFWIEDSYFLHHQELDIAQRSFLNVQNMYLDTLQQFTKTNRWDDIRNYWYKDVEDFRKLSKKYYLYK